MKKFKWVEHPIPLVFKREALLGYKRNEISKAPRPVISINNDFLVLSNSFVIIRHLFLIPALLSVLYLCATEVQDVYKSWKASEQSTLNFIEFRKKTYGNDYFETLAPNKKHRDIILYKYNRLDENNKLTFDQFLIDRYGDKLYEFGDWSRRHDRNSIIFFGTTIPLYSFGL